MRFTVITAILLFISQFCFAQDFQAQFKAAVANSDTAKQKEILRLWENEVPTDAELFTSAFNYHFNKAEREVVQITTYQPRNVESLLVSDSLGNPAGYMRLLNTMFLKLKRALRR